MNNPKQAALSLSYPLALASAAGLMVLLAASQTQAFPTSSVTFKDNAPFKGSTTNASLTSSDGLLTVAGWADTNATAAANLYQWWWIFGVSSGTGNGALLDGQESMTLRFDRSVGASQITFLYTGNSDSPATPARLAISGFVSDPQAYATVYTSPRISNLNYSNGVLTFDYLYDAGKDYGQLLFANPAASAGQTLKITYSGTSWGAALFRVASQEVFGGPMVQPVSVRYNWTNAYTTPDKALTVRAYADRSASTATNFGTYLDQCFGPYGGANNAAIEGDETVTLQFSPDYGLARLEGVYSSGQVSISGFKDDPGFSDSANGSFGAQYGGGVLSFYPMDGGHHVYFFTNRAASAGQTLQINVDPTAGYAFAIAGLGYTDMRTLLASDVQSDVSTSYTTPDGLLTVNGYADTPGTSPGYLFLKTDWLGIAGGKNDQAIDGTESLEMQFTNSVGLSGLGTRYTGGTIVISGFASDPGLVDPSGTATAVSYDNGTLSYTFNAWHPSETVVHFSNVAASRGRTLSLHTDGGAGSQIALTRINYSEASAPVRLTINRVGDQVVLTWPAGILQQSTNVAGPYADVPGAASPYTNTLSGAQSFFRVKVQ